MVISNIARREIAQKFYMEAQAWRYTLPDDVCDLGDASAVMQDMCYFVGLQGNVLYCDIFQRFAELIDPTVCEDSGNEERAAKCGKHSDGIDVSKCVIRLIDPPDMPQPCNQASRRVFVQQVRRTRGHRVYGDH